MNKRKEENISTVIFKIICFIYLIFIENHAYAKSLIVDRILYKQLFTDIQPGYNPLAADGNTITFTKNGGIKTTNKPSLKSNYPFFINNNGIIEVSSKKINEKNTKKKNSINKAVLAAVYVTHGIYLNNNGTINASSDGYGIYSHSQNNTSTSNAPIPSHNTLIINNSGKIHSYSSSAIMIKDESNLHIINAGIISSAKKNSIETDNQTWITNTGTIEGYNGIVSHTKILVDNASIIRAYTQNGCALCLAGDSTIVLRAGSNIDGAITTEKLSHTTLILKDHGTLNSTILGSSVNLSLEGQSWIVGSQKMTFNKIDINSGLLQLNGNVSLDTITFYNKGALKIGNSTITTPADIFLFNNSRYYINEEIFYNENNQYIKINSNKLQSFPKLILFQFHQNSSILKLLDTLDLFKEKIILNSLNGFKEDSIKNTKIVSNMAFLKPTFYIKEKIIYIKLVPLNPNEIFVVPNMTQKQRAIGQLLSERSKKIDKNKYIKSIINQALTISKSQLAENDIYSGEIYSDLIPVMFQNTYDFSKKILFSQRQDASCQKIVCVSGAISMGWMRFIHQNDINNVTNKTSSIYLGIFTSIFKKSRIGISGSIIKNNISTNTISQSAILKTYVIGAYIHTNSFFGLMSDVVFGYAKQNALVKRNIYLPNKLGIDINEGKAKAQQGFINSSIYVNFNFLKSITITPNFGMYGALVKQNSINETEEKNAGLNLHINTTRKISIQTSIGVRSSIAFPATSTSLTLGFAVKKYWKHNTPLKMRLEQNQNGILVNNYGIQTNTYAFVTKVGLKSTLAKNLNVSVQFNSTNSNKEQLYQIDCGVSFYF